MTPLRPISNLEYALLGLVSHGEKSAYAIKQIFEDTPMARFSASPGAIYPALSRLQEKGLVSAKSQPGDRGRAKRTYRLTAKGAAALDKWLAKKPDIVELNTDAALVMLRFSFMDGRCSRTEISRFLSDLNNALTEQTRDLDKRIKEFRRLGADHAALTLEAGLMGVRAHLRWTDKARRNFSAAETGRPS